MKKKFFAILVAGAVFFSMLPMVAFGDTGNGSEPPNGAPQTEMNTPNSTDPDDLIDPEEPDGEGDVYAESGDMSKTSAKMKAGAKMQLSVINENPAGSFIDVYWETTNMKVATVEQDGKVTALKAGKCTISATFPKGKVITCKVTVPSKYQGTKVPDFGAKFGKLRYDTEHWGEDPDVHIYYKKVSKDQVKKYLAAVKKAGLKKQKMSDGRTCYQHANGDGITYSLKKGELHINLYNIHDFDNSGADEE